MSQKEMLLRLLLALVLGGLVGLEREIKGRAAGFRTQILVCVGSALMMLTGLYLRERQVGMGDIDPTRIAAQVVTGIGFIGAGTILQTPDSIRGLTTAASVWVSCGIGIAAGAGFYWGAIATTLVALVVLFLFHDFEQSVRK
jgi:putative Mg2+ transporter-C (MgtC) family protein